MLKLEVVAAKHGDCLILHYGKEARPRRILIDGGPPGVYRRHLRPRLKELREESGVDRPVKFELAMVSHIDQDHIKGLLELTDEMIREEGTHKDLAEIKRFWHNSFSDITGGTETSAVMSASNAIVASAEAGGQTPFSGLAKSDGRAELILAGIGQGRQLRDNLDKLGLDGNRPFDETLVLQGKKATLPGDMNLTIVGPDRENLIALQQKWNPSLSPVEVAEMSDKSVANLSSIVVMVENEGKTILLTGDARGDDIVDGLKATGFLKDGKCKVDVLKLQHHGSDRNVNEAFFEAVKADIYVYCGDGKHDNPDAPTLKMMREARSGDEYRVVFSNFVTMEHPSKQPAFDAEIRALRDEGINVEVRDNDENSITIDLS